MGKEILKCPICKKYTIKKLHCTETISVKPAKFSPEDKFGIYRRKYKKENDLAY